jgi:hypothetical protein
MYIYHWFCSYFSHYHFTVYECSLRTSKLCFQKTHGTHVRAHTYTLGQNLRAVGLEIFQESGVFLSDTFHFRGFLECILTYSILSLIPDIRYHSSTYTGKSTWDLTILSLI